MGQRRSGIESLCLKPRKHFMSSSITGESAALNQVTTPRNCSRLYHSDPSLGTFRSVREKRLLASSLVGDPPTRVTALLPQEKALHSELEQIPPRNGRPTSREDEVSSLSSELDMNCAMSQPPFPRFERSKTPSGLPTFGSPQALSCDYRSLSLSLRKQAAANSARSSSSSLAKGNITCVSVVKKAWHSFKSAISEAIYSFTNYESEPFDVPGPLRSRGVIAVAPDGTLVRTFFPRRQSAHGTGLVCHPYLRAQHSSDNWAARAVRDEVSTSQHAGF